MSKVLIIAEAGVNHNGSIEIAKDLVLAAKESGADAVKFQMFKAETLVGRTARKADYQLKTTAADESQFEMLEKLQLSESDHMQLLDYANQLNIKFLSSPFDEQSVDFLDGIGIEMFKIPSGEITNKSYLRRISKKNKKVILSTGMSKLKEISVAIEILLSNGLEKDKLILLHCNTEYPTPMIDVNLLAMQSLKNEFNICVGYSDHTLGIEIPIAAVALGAIVIEKHFTLDRSMIGPDHKASIEPAEFKRLVESIRNVELAISGNGKKEPSYSELKNRVIVRKSLHLAMDLPPGHIISENDLVALRPGDGISPMEIDKVLNRVLKNAQNKNHKLNWLDLL